MTGGESRFFHRSALHFNSAENNRLEWCFVTTLPCSWQINEKAHSTPYFSIWVSVKQHWAGRGEHGGVQWCWGGGQRVRVGQLCVQRQGNSKRPGRFGKQHAESCWSVKVSRDSGKGKTQVI